MIFIVVQMEL